MAEPLNTQTESWRTRREPTIDPHIRTMALLAIGVIGIAGLGIGGYAMLGHRMHAVPVVAADPRPVRVRPDNPGGLQVMGADELAGATVAGMAQPPEAPAPEALQAKIKAELRAAAVAAAPVAQPAPVVQAAPVPVVKPVAPVVQAAPEPPVEPPRPVVAKPVGTAQVQLGALDSEMAAKTEWQRLGHKMPELLASRQPAVLRAERAGHVFFRLRTGGFADVAAATAFCAQVHAKGVGCSIASF